MKLYKNIEDFINNNKLNDDVVTFLHSLNKETPLGIHKLSNNNYVNVVEYTTDFLTTNEIEFESHKKYIDVHICLDGDEIVYLSDITLCNNKTPYNVDDDYESLVGKQKEVVTLSVLQPLYVDTDVPHAPGFSFETNKKVKKAILKLVKA